MRRTLILLPLLALASLAAAVPSASACTCFPLSLEAKYELADAVLLGDVVEIVSAEPEHPAGYVWAVLDVKATWKGEPAPTVRVLEYAQAGGCGVPFTVGNRFLVFAMDAEGSVDPADLRSSSCLGTRLSMPDDPDVALLGAPPPPPSQLQLAVTVRPNPSQASARLVWTIPPGTPSGSHARLDVLDVLGRHIVTLENGPVDPGPYRTLWDGRDAQGRRTPAGFYRVRLECAGRVTSQSLVRIGQ